MKQTAVDFLKEKLTYVFVNDKSFNDLFEQAKEMEKRQIIEAHNSGYSEGIYQSCESGEQYYNETFKSE